MFHWWKVYQILSRYILTQEKHGFCERAFILPYNGSNDEIIENLSH